ncbi:MAG: phosphatidate cytidylyltransferase [Oscillospiraceae bacterium]
MLKRIIVGLLSAAFAIGVLFAMNTPVYAIMIAIFTFIAAREIEKVVQIKNKAIYILSLAFSIFVPFYYEYNDELLQRGINLPITAILVIYILLLFILMLTDYENTKFEDVAAVLVASLAVPWGFSTLIMLRDVSVTYPGVYDKIHGLFFVLLALFCAWLADTCAYFTGKFLGKHKLSPKISPKKTIEGAIGGTLGATACSVALFAVFDNVYFTTHILTYWQIIIIALVLSTVGMCGDLTASVVKRNFGVKDFGKLFPGHGGVMDRFDSALFVLCTLVAIITIMRA